MKAIRGVIVCAAIAVAGWNDVSSAGTYEHARLVGKRCSTCHDSKMPHLANLNAAGRYFLTRRTLDGYTPATGRVAQRGKTPSNASLGRAVFTRSCSVCHGADGQGTALAKALTGPRQHAPTEAAAIQVIRNGIKGTTMAPFGMALKDEEIRAVAKYVMTLKAPRR
ncbi:MAG: cytochrome c [Acidobacteria bacterium]|nr:cytochrome c [Acidobacteriota bacterium]MCA1651438.1 cytochrome c [Acidobacteriota bacterium]